MTRGFARRLRASVVAAGVLLCPSVTLAADPEGRIDIAFWHAMAGDLGDTVQTLCDGFNRRQTAFHVDCVYKGDYDTVLQNAIAAYRAGKQPALLQVLDIGTTGMMRSGVFVPVDRLLADNDAALDWADVLPAIGAYYRAQDGSYPSLPFNVSTAVLYWNRSALTTPPDTWDALEDQAKSLQAKGWACPFAFDADPWFLIEQFAAVEGLPLATKESGLAGMSTRLSINQAAFTAHLRLIKRMTDAHLAVYFDLGNARIRAFARGHCAMALGATSHFRLVDRAASEGLEWAAAALPATDGQRRHRTLVGGASIWALKGSTPDQLKAAAAFLAFLAAPDQAVAWSRATGYLPVTTTALVQLQRTLDEYSPAAQLLQTAMMSLADRQGDGVLQNARLAPYTQIRSDLGDAITLSLSGDSDPQAALDVAAARGNAALVRFDRLYGAPP